MHAVGALTAMRAHLLVCIKHDRAFNILYILRVLHY
jgi:hypothetical protein